MESIGSNKAGAGIDMDGLYATELRLGLPSTTSAPAVTPSAKTKRPREEEPTVELSSKSSCCSSNEETSSCCNDDHHLAPSPPAKAQVVGWPPVQSFRVKSNAVPQDKKQTDAPPKKETKGSSGLLVKVSMDGAPYLRKIDVGSYTGYDELCLALRAMFRRFSPVVHHQQAAYNTVTYEDKDGDWMLVGDEPWEMFTSSCKRLRIMRSSTTEGVIHH